MSTGITTATSCAAARRPATSPAIGARTSVPSSSTSNGSSYSCLPTAIRSSHASPSIRHARSASVSLVDPRERLRRAEARARPADEQDARQLLDPPRLGVDVAPAAADEAAERDAAVGGELDREARRRADRDEDRTARDRRLLHELEREPAAHAEHVLGERQQPVEERPADDLVHRVVAADVLARAQQLARGVEEPGRVQAARHLEGRLRLAQPLGKRGDERERDAQLATRRAAPRPRPPRALPCRRRRTTTRCRSSAAAAPDRSRARRRRPCSRRDRPAPARRAAAAPRRDRSRARAPRRGPACAS